MRSAKLGMLAAVITPMLMACEANPPDRQTSEVGNRSAPAVRQDREPRAEPESIVRQDVLAETAVSPEPKIETVKLTLDFSEADETLPTAAAIALDELLERPIMAASPCITIRGHTDSLGSDKANLEVSEERARAVAEYLLEKGVAENRIRLVAIGERRPVAPNANPDGSDYPEGRAKNRRVELEIEPATGKEPIQCGDAETTMSDGSHRPR